MRIVVVAALLFASAAVADVAKPVVVDVPPSPVGTLPADAPVIADIQLDDLEAAPAPSYNRSRWLLTLPMLALLAVLWNVDWRERRVKAEIAAARAARAPRPRGGA